MRIAAINPVTDENTNIKTVPIWRNILTKFFIHEEVVIGFKLIKASNLIKAQIIESVKINKITYQK